MDMHDEEYEEYYEYLKREDFEIVYGIPYEEDEEIKKNYEDLKQSHDCFLRELERIKKLFKEGNILQAGRHLNLLAPAAYGIYGRAVLITMAKENQKNYMKSYKHKVEKLEKEIIEIEGKSTDRLKNIIKEFNKNIRNLEKEKQKKENKLREKELIEEQYKLKRLNARIETQFKKEIFLPSFIEWKNGELFYKNKTNFIKEMLNQFVTFSETQKANKNNITERTLQRWLPKDYSLEDAKKELEYLKNTDKHSLS